MSSNTIDPRVRKLVRSINSYPGIQTVMSCGGHSKPNEKRDRCQVPENEFWVEFEFTTPCPTKEAWQSLKTILQAIEKVPNTDKTAYSQFEWVHKQGRWIALEVTDMIGNVYFKVYGCNIDPNEIILEHGGDNKGLRVLHFPKVKVGDTR